MQRELRVELSEKKIGKAFMVALIPALPIPSDLMTNEIVTGCAVIAANDENENGIYAYVHLESDEKEFIGDALANACVPMNTWVWCQLFCNK